MPPDEYTDHDLADFLRIYASHQYSVQGKLSGEKVIWNMQHPLSLDQSGQNDSQSNILQMPTNLTS